jgi:competence protein ComEC
LVDNAAVIVIDAGPGTPLLEYLRQEGITHVDALLISHADQDHIKGVISLLESKITIDVVRLNTDSKKDTDLWKDLRYELDCASQDGKLQFEVGLTSSDTGKFNTEQIGLEILAPRPYLAAGGPGSSDRNGRTLTTNSLSAVVRLTNNGNPLLLLPGDIDNTGFENLVESQSHATAPVAVFPHHGGRPGSTQPGAFARRFCEVVAPETIIFSIGRGQHETPQHAVIEAICERDPHIRILCTQLSEHCAARLTANDPSHLTEKFAKGKEKDACCAGTIVIELAGDQLRLLPDQNSHLAFIERAAPTALCLAD